jgi:hypothetical protein
MITKYLLLFSKIINKFTSKYNLFQNKTQIPLVAESTLLRTIAHLGEIGNQVDNSPLEKAFSVMI